MTDLILMRIARWCVEQMQRLTHKRYALTSSDLMSLGPEKLVELRRFLEDVDKELHAANSLQMQALAQECAQTTR